MAQSSERLTLPERELLIRKQLADSSAVLESAAWSQSEVGKKQVEIHSKELLSGEQPIKNSQRRLQKIVRACPSMMDFLQITRVISSKFSKEPDEFKLSVAELVAQKRQEGDKRDIFDIFIEGK